MLAVKLRVRPGVIESTNIQKVFTNVALETFYTNGTIQQSKTDEITMKWRAVVLAEKICGVKLNNDDIKNFSVDGFYAACAIYATFPLILKETNIDFYLEKYEIETGVPSVST